MTISNVYEDFVLIRKNLDGMPMSNNLFVHEIMYNLYKDQLSADYSVGSSSAKYYKINGEFGICLNKNLFGTFDKFKVSCEMTSILLAKAIKSNLSTIAIDNTEFEEIAKKAVLDTDCKIYNYSLSSDVIVIMEKILDNDYENIFNFYIFLQKYVKFN